MHARKVSSVMANSLYTPYKSNNTFKTEKQSEGTIEPWIHFDTELNWIWQKTKKAKQRLSLLFSFWLNAFHLIAVWNVSASNAVNIPANTSSVSLLYNKWGDYVTANWRVFVRLITRNNLNSFYSAYCYSLIAPLLPRFLLCITNSFVTIFFLSHN